ncbi:lysophospholipid acyltransferase family protein [Verrucomicrobiota bacterium sgz303538]
MSKEKLLSWLVATLMRTLGRTLRIEVCDQAGYFDKQRNRPFIIAAWHNRILVLPYAFEKLRPKHLRPLSVLTSASRDGGLLAAVVGHFKIGAVRGSSSRRGALALRELTATLEQDTDVIITPDGPRGPVYTLGQGIVFLAQKTGLPVMRVHVEYTRFWELKSWDRFRIPKPFSRVGITLSPSETIGPTASDAEFEEQRLRLEKLLRGEATEEAERV